MSKQIKTLYSTWKQECRLISGHIVKSIQSVGSINQSMFNYIALCTTQLKAMHTALEKYKSKIK